MEILWLAFKCLLLIMGIIFVTMIILSMLKSIFSIKKDFNVIEADDEIKKALIELLKEDLKKGKK